MNRTLIVNDCKNLGLQAVLITILAVFWAWSVNLMRDDPLPWDWSPPPPSVPLLNDIDEFRAILAQPETVLVDTRGSLFYEMGHLPGALNLPVEETDEAAIEAWRRKLPDGARLVLYCSDDLCPMADQMARKMKPLGLSPLIFAPGYAAWEALGLPIETGN